MTTMPTTTVDISTVDHLGRPKAVHHAAMRSLDDACREVRRFTPAPVGPCVRRRIQLTGEGSFSIGQFDVSIALLGFSPSVPCTF